MRIKTNIGDLKTARKWAGLTQAELAAAVGVNRALICYLENGRVDPATVTHGTLVRIVRVLRQHGLKPLTLDDLFPASKVA
jgi:predicted transcriptional regulator